MLSEILMKFLQYTHVEMQLIYRDWQTVIYIATQYFAHLSSKAINTRSKHIAMHVSTVRFRCKLEYVCID